MVQIDLPMFPGAPLRGLCIRDIRQQLTCELTCELSSSAGRDVTQQARTGSWNEPFFEVP